MNLQKTIQKRFFLLGGILLLNFDQTSFLKISRGALFNMLRLLIKPIITVRRDKLAKMIITGSHEIVKDELNVNFARSQLPISERMIPVAAASAPRKKYSIAVMLRICLRLA